MFCFVENDVKLSAGLIFRVGEDTKFSMYSGLGANISSSFGNELLVFENHTVETGVVNDFTSIDNIGSQNSYTGKSIAYGRLYLPIGVSVKLLRHLEANAELKVGQGVEQVIGGSANTFRTGEFSFGVRYNFKKNKAKSILDFI